MNTLFATLYTSVIALDQHPSSVGNIVRTARHNNNAQQLTGLLMFDGMNFCQYLEGPETELRQLLDRITRDPRHGKFSIKQPLTTITQRRFPEQSMGYGLAMQEDLLARFNERGALSPFALLDQTVPLLSLNP